MKTEIFQENISGAAQLILKGELVAVPTETVYGLAGNGLNASAVNQIYEVKGRPTVKALSLMVPDAGAFARYCTDVPKAAYHLAEKFWPGPLTIVLKARDFIPKLTIAGGDTVGLRCPDHPMTLALLRECGLPLAAPSANPSGEPSPKNAETVLDYFDGKIAGVINGGVCGFGVESTILDLSKVPYRILRQGALSEQEINRVLREGVTLIGITGGTGSGKTTALRVLHSFGALILDCDEIYHELTVSSVPLREALIGRFGEVYDGNILNRRKLGEIVFADPEALNDLNQITRSFVSDALDQKLTEFARNGGSLAAIDAIGLLDLSQAGRSLVNVAITAPEEQRVQRLIAREGISEAYARKRIAAQKDDAYFAAHCDAVLVNDGTKEEFSNKCSRYFTEVLKNV